MAGLYTLSKSERLTSNKLIEKIFKREGELISKFPLSFIFLEVLLPENVPAQVLFSVSSKKVKRAHDRNYIKRLLRECYRLHKPLLYQQIQKVEGRQYALCLMYNSDVLPEYSLISEKFNKLMHDFTEKTS